MSGAERRKKIIEILRTSDKPVSATAFARELGVSRQVIVQDVALLRANGSKIIATPRGYVIEDANSVSRVFKVNHDDEDVENELFLIVDLGGIIHDVFIYHKVYGTIRAEMNIRSRRDVKIFLEEIFSGKSTLLKNVTSNYHYHTVIADSAEQLDQIQDALAEAGFLAPLQNYEPVDFWEE